MGLFGGMAAAKPLGFMAAQPVTQVAAGYVNSGQHAIRGRFIPFRSSRWGKPYTQALLTAARLGLWRDLKSHCLRQWAPLGICGCLAYANIFNKILGGWSRPITARQKA